MSFYAAHLQVTGVYLEVRAVGPKEEIAPEAVLAAAEEHRGRMLLGVYAKRALLVLAILALAVEGVFVYRFYDRTYEDHVALGATNSEPKKATVKERQRMTPFVHRAGSKNIVDNSTYVDHPLINGNPDAILFVTQIGKSGRDASNTHPIGVWYDENRGGRWAIFNQNLAPMPEGTIFNVVVSEEPGGTLFIHRSTSANTMGGSTYVDHPLMNENPEAILLVTPNWNPGGGTGTYNNHPVGIGYDADEDRWVIFNRDLAPMPQRVAFDVAVLSGNTT